ncbi:GldG family protein [Pontiella sp.]|uniref:GldG family protein n=1 Tax=Pontiella sp. TaxID=2837462 RepID=UPI0035645DC4
MKRFLSSLNSLFAVLLAFVVVQMVCFISLRNPVRANWSGRAYYDLSDKTLKLLRELEQEITVTVFFQEEHKLFYDIENLLEEYQYHSRNIKVEWVDPARDPARTEQLANKYGLTEAQVVVFDIGDKRKVVKQTDLADSRVLKGHKEPTYTAFKGEQAFSSAIYGLMQGEKPKVYFLVGHGEHRLTDFDQISGYSRIGTTVLGDNLEVAELMLSGEKLVPDDAAALVIAGPDKTMSSIEVEMIEDYLNRSGRVMVMLDALKETGLEPMLRRWGVALRQDIVVDPENTLRGSDVHIRRYNAHPISMEMGSIVQFFLPRSIQPLSEEEGATAKDRPSVVPLFFTSEKSWSEMQTEESTARFDEDKGDKRGPFSLGVAVERGATQEVLDVQIKPSRMVVFGDSDFVTNGGLVGGNVDLFMSALNWLLEREELMAIAPKPIEEVKLSLSRKQLNQMFWLNVTGIPAIAMVLGLFVWVRRRK